jgi:hypothetical protein
MNTKLTLTIEKEVIEIAKEYAKEKGLSLFINSEIAVMTPLNFLKMKAINES